MPSHILPPPKSAEENGADDDYFLDMIEELARQARALGEVEVAVHLEATALARRHALNVTPPP